MVRESSNERHREIITERQIPQLEKIRFLDVEKVFCRKLARQYFVGICLRIHRRPREARAIASPVLDVEHVVTALVVEQAVKAQLLEDDEVV